MLERSARSWPTAWAIALAAATPLLAVGALSITLRAEPAINSSPKPEMLKAEADHIAKLDAALAPIRNYAPSLEDAGRVRDAIAAVKSNDMARFNGLKAAITDPVGKKLVEWVRLKAGYGEASEYQAFLKENPLFPDRATMVQRM